LQELSTDVIIIKERKVIVMSIVGYYDGTAVRVEEPLQMNQKVIVIPIESEMNLEETAAGGLQQYVNPSLVCQEKDAWRKVAIKKHENGYQG